jgi:dephospho-CoA kinase
MPGAGKEEFVKVALENGFKVVRMGDVVRAEASRRGIAMTDQEVGGFASAERKEHGPGIWATRCLPFLEGHDTVIDGSRSTFELDVFRKSLGRKVRLVAIHASPSLRFERLRRRNRSDAPQTLEEFRRRDEREMGWGLGNLIAQADLVIMNEGTLEEFHRRVKEELDRAW